MANFFNKIKVKTGLQAHRNKFDLSCTHTTTQDFYQNVPIYVKEVIPGEKVHINMRSFTRCSPLQQPLYGQINTKTRAFFVPCRTLMYGFNEFITGTPAAGVSAGASGIIQFVPRFTMSTLYGVLTNGAYATASSTSLTGDFYYKNGSNANWYVLNSTGRLVTKILMSLGYKLNIGSTVNSQNDDSSVIVSAMPLLAFAKVWSDWFSNPQYDTHTVFDNIFTAKSQAYMLTSSELSNILSYVQRLCYGADYFTSAWDNPVSPNSSSLGNLEPVIDVPDVTFGTSSGGQNIVSNSAHSFGASSDQVANNGTPRIYQRSSTGTDTGASQITHISQFMIDALHSVSDFVKRHQMVGSRALDRYMAEYGIQLQSEKLNRSVYLGGSVGNFNIADVTQTAPVDGYEVTGVGNYTGKMIGSGNGSFDYSSDEYGFIIITAYIEPKPMYVDGRPRYLQHVSKLDFFTGDFDNLGVQAIRYDEIASNFLLNDADRVWKANSIFGFTPRYSEYKVGFDNLTGDFIWNSTNQSLDGWYLARRMSPDFTQDFKHDTGFCLADGSQFSKIFQDTSNNFDHFFTVFRFDVDVYAPMKSIFDMYDYSNENGKDMSMTLNGRSASN